MSTGKTVARDYRSKAALEVTWESGRITSLRPTLETPAASTNLWIAPLLVDVQVNGYAGVDFQQDGLTGAELLMAVRGLQRDGCGAILLTLITDEWPRLLARLRHLRALRDVNSELREAIIGWHIEGPFL
jgi:N-acetylglucosamine-6-phosphate deacetylase